MSDRYDPSWHQMALIQPEVLEATLKIGAIPSTNHIQWWLELKDPTTGNLIAMASRPTGDIRAMDEIVTEACARLLSELRDAADPF